MNAENIAQFGLSALLSTAAAVAVWFLISAIIGAIARLIGVMAGSRAARRRDRQD